MNTNRSILVLLCAAALASCEKNAVQNITEPFASGARVKFFNFGVNAPGVNFYANDTKMTAISSVSGTEATTGVTYGNAGAGGFYSAIAPGQYTLRGRIAATTDKDLAISNLTATLADGKSYSFYQSGIYNAAAKTVDAFVVEDNFSDAFDYSVAYVRFVNAISNSDAMALYAKHTVSGEEVKVGGEAAYKAAGAFTALPGGFYDLSTRVAGSTANAVTRTGVSFNSGRIYTITARGDMTVTSTRALDNTANR